MRALRGCLRSALVTAALPVLALAVPGPASASSLPDMFADSLVIGGFDYPVGMAFLPDRRLFVIEQKTAKIRLVVHGALALTDPVATLPNVETSGTEQGVLGIAVDPGWPTRPYIYLHIDDPSGFIRISRYTVTGDLAFTGNGALSVNPASRYDLIDDIPDDAPNHNGGTLRFGPDGRLYDSSGDDAKGCPAQDLTTLVGKILRLDVSRLPAGPGSAPRALVAPPDNPYAVNPDSNARLVWAIGLRNPFRFGVDPQNGDLWVGDVGNQQYEEIDQVTETSNLEWPTREGPVSIGFSCGSTGTPPIYYYDDGPTAAAIIAAGIYRRPTGSSTGFPPEYEGDVFLSDYYYGFLRRVKFTGAAWEIAPPEPNQPSALNWGTGFDAVSDWLVGPDGALWYCKQAVNFANNTGQIRCIVNQTPTNQIPSDSLARPLFLAPQPNPAQGPVSFRWNLPHATPVTLSIFDATGRRIRTFQRSSGSPNLLLWDRNDAEGHPMRPGMYLARLEVDGATLDHRFALIR